MDNVRCPYCRRETEIGYKKDAWSKLVMCEVCGNRFVYQIKLRKVKRIEDRRLFESSPKD